MLKSSLTCERLWIAEASEVLDSIELCDIREDDVKEFEDSVPGIKEHLGSLSPVLMAMMGFLSFSVKAYLFTYDAKHAMVITSHRNINEKSRILCGFAWKWADAEIPRKTRLEMIRLGIENLIINEEDCQEFVCYVRADNEETLKHWQLAGKMFPQITVKIEWCSTVSSIETNSLPNYKKVIIIKGVS